MIGIITSAGLLCLIMYIVARHEADYSLPKVILISVGLAACNLVLSLTIGALLALPILVGLTVWALHQFCYLRWGMASIITGIYIVCQIVVGILLVGLIK